MQRRGVKDSGRWASSKLRRASAEGEQEGDTTVTTSKVGEAGECVLVRLVDAPTKDEANAFESRLDEGLDVFGTKLGGAHRVTRGGPRSVLVEDVVDRGKSAGESRGGGACAHGKEGAGRSNTDGEFFREWNRVRYTRCFIEEHLLLLTILFIVCWPGRRRSGGA